MTTELLTERRSKAGRAGRSRGRKRELRYAEHLEEQHGGLARRFESGSFDIVWLRPGKPPTLIQVKGTDTPWHTFGPTDRKAAVEQAKRAGAEPVLLHWPKGVGVSKARWYEVADWPS